MDWAATLIFALAIIVGLFLLGLTLLYLSRAIAKAGFSPWWALIALVPVVNVVMLWVFAFARWPALSTVDQRK
jgi:hypothetical protein